MLLCAGASIAASPLIALSLLAPEYQQSFAALLIGFALSETWRAPAAVLVKDVSPPKLGATGSALHLSIRNLVGGCGPLSKPLPPTPVHASLKFQCGWAVHCILKCLAVKEPCFVWLDGSLVLPAWHSMSAFQVTVVAALQLCKQL